MPLTPLQRQILIENTMSQLCMIGLGDYRSIYGVIGFLERLLNMPKKHSVNIDDRINVNALRELSSAGITAQDIEIAAKKRPENRDLLKKITLRLLEPSRNIEKAERIILNALYDGSSEVLSSEELTELKAARILNVDTGWFFFPDSTHALQVILDNANYSPAEAFVFLDSLSHEQKKNIYTLAVHFHQRISDDASKLIHENVHPDEIIADYNRRANGEVFVQTHAPELYDDLFKPDVVPHFLSKRLIHEIQAQYITHWLNLHWGNLAATVLTQPVVKAKSLMDNAYAWLKVRVTPGKSEKPFAIDDLAPAIPNVEPSSRFMDLLSDIYLERTWGRPSLNYRFIDVNKDEPLYLFLYNDSPELQAELNNVVLTPQNFSTVFTAEVKAELSVLATAKSKRVVLDEINAVFRREIYALPAAQGILLTQAFSQWMQCYVKNNCTSQIMTALWTEKNVPEIMPTLAQNITDSVYSMTTTPVQNAQDSSYEIYVAGFMGVLGVSTLACMAARRFFKPAAANTQRYTPVSMVEEHRPGSKIV